MLYKVEGHTDMKRKCDGQEFRRKPIYILILYVCCTFTGNNKLLVVHRQNPCTPLHGLQSLTAADVLHRDTSFIRRRFSSQSSVGAAPGPAPSPTATIIPANGSSDPSTLPGVLDYSVHISYGTPEQQFPVILDTIASTRPCPVQPVRLMFR